MTLRCAVGNEVLALEPPYPVGETLCKRHGGTVEAVKEPKPLTRAERDAQRLEEYRVRELGELGDEPPVRVEGFVEPKPLLAGSPPIATAALAASQAVGVENLEKVRPTLEREHARAYWERVEADEEARADAEEASEDDHSDRAKTARARARATRQGAARKGRTTAKRADAPGTDTPPSTNLPPPVTPPPAY